MDEKAVHAFLLMSPASSTNPFLLVLFLWYLLHFLSVSFLGSCCSSNLFVQCTPDKWTTLVPSNIGPFIQLVNISDLTYTMYILYYTIQHYAFYLVDKIE